MAPRLAGAPLRLSLTAASLAIVTAASPAVRADDTQDLEGLLNETVVAGASKTAERASDAPATVSSLTAEDIRRYGIRSLSDAVNFLATAFLTRDPLSSVDMGARGVMMTADYGNHVLVVVDGHTVNEPSGGTVYFDQGLGIPLDVVDHIEVIVGPGSVLYGGNAMLGVINIVTKSASRYEGAHLVAEGGASPAQSGGRLASAPGDSGGFYRLGVGWGVPGQLLGKPFELTGQLEVFSRSGPSFTWGPQQSFDLDGVTPANFGPRAPSLGTWAGTTHRQYYATVPSAYVRARWDEITATLRAASFSRATPEINSSNQTASDFDDPLSYERDQWLAADLKLTHRLGERSLVSARLYGDLYSYQSWSHSSDPSNCVLPVSGPCTDYHPAAVQWAGLELQESQDWLGDERLTTLVGIDPRLRHMAGKLDALDATGRDVGTVGTGVVTDATYGVYLQQRWTPVAPLHLNAGARFDHDPHGGDHLSPRAAATWSSWRGGTLKGLYSEAFRAPSLYEWGFAAVTPAGALLANPGLRPEVVRSVEGSFEQKVGPHRVFVGVFRSWWLDMVELALTDPATYSTQYQNTSSIDNWGFNAGVDGDSGALHYGASLTGAYSRRNTAGGQIPLTVTPQVFGNARAAYDLPRRLPTLALAVSFVGPSLADRALDGNFPVTPVAPASLDLRATASGPVPFARGLSYRVSGDYVTASQGPYVVGPHQFIPAGTPNAPMAQLVPINRLTLFATLQYDLFE